MTEQEKSIIDDNIIALSEFAKNKADMNNEGFQQFIEDIERFLASQIFAKSLSAVSTNQSVIVCYGDMSYQKEHIINYDIIKNRSSSSNSPIEPQS